MSYFPIKIQIVEGPETGVEKIVDHSQVPNGVAFKVLETNISFGKHFTQWMQENKHPIESGGNAKALQLMDGTTLSIQASRFHYCEPRIDLDFYNLYDSFEIGYPSTVIGEILSYAEDEENPTETVYGWVPKSVIEEFINKRGGVRGIKNSD